MEHRVINHLIGPCDPMTLDGVAIYRADDWILSATRWFGFPTVAPLERQPWNPANDAPPWRRYPATTPEIRAAELTSANWQPWIGSPSPSARALIDVQINLIRSYGIWSGKRHQRPITSANIWRWIAFPTARVDQFGNTALIPTENWISWYLNVILSSILRRS